ncbi:hypothetical protein [Halorubrum sp. DTA98]|uniref:hypothetical protein n=1 Tax=Halorubrum sp. DTA98 TaxID=3402163 RepID=UPI003AAAB444
MEPLLLSSLFALVVAYGVVCASAPELSFRLDGPLNRMDGDPGAIAVRNRRYAGWISVAAGVFGAAYLVGLVAVVGCVVAAGVASAWLTIRG